MAIYNYANPSNYYQGEGFCLLVQKEGSDEYLYQEELAQKALKGEE